MKKILFLLISFVILFKANAEEKKQTICLNMIVKNEKNVIKRCLNSVKNFVDYWIIVDTGSTDGTQDIIKEFMKEIPGELHEYPWVNFEFNRNLALQLAKDKSDYILFMDADDELAFSKNFKKPFLDKDEYLIEIKYNGTSYYRGMLAKSSVNWFWIGVVHEVLISDAIVTHEVLPNVANVVHSDGFRSQDPEKYQKDAMILEKELQKNPYNSRYRFYLAQSYRDCNNYLLAIENYEKRIKLGGWEEEVFCSILQIAKLQQLARMDPQTFLENYFKAFVFRPVRLEPLYYLISYYRAVGNYQMGYNLAKMGEQIEYPKNDILFIEDWIYKFGFLLEYSVCAYWLEKYSEFQEISKKILSKQDLPENVYECVRRNLGFIKEKP